MSVIDVDALRLRGDWLRGGHEITTSPAGTPPNFYWHERFGPSGYVDNPRFSEWLRKHQGEFV